MPVFYSAGAKEKGLVNAAEDGTRPFTNSASCSVLSSFFALDQLAQSAVHHKELFRGGFFF